MEKETITFKMPETLEDIMSNPVYAMIYRLGKEIGVEEYERTGKKNKQGEA